MTESNFVVTPRETHTEPEPIGMHWLELITTYLRLSISGVFSRSIYPDARVEHRNLAHQKNS
jgi:hypothetical protein